MHISKPDQIQKPVNSPKEETAPKAKNLTNTVEADSVFNAAKNVINSQNCDAKIKDIVLNQFNDLSGADINNDKSIDAQEAKAFCEKIIKSFANTLKALQGKEDKSDPKEESTEKPSNGQRNVSETYIKNNDLSKLPEDEQVSFLKNEFNRIKNKSNGGYNDKTIIEIVKGNHKDLSPEVINKFEESFKTND